MINSWFIEIEPLDCTGREEAKKEPERVMLDRKAMNLGGSARAFSSLLSQIYAHKILINNQLPGRGKYYQRVDIF